MVDVKIVFVYLYLRVFVCICANTPKNGVSGSTTSVLRICQLLWACLRRLVALVVMWQCGRWQNVFEFVFVFSYLCLCPKCIWDQIHKYKTSFNAHRSSWTVRRWWLWRFWWSDATRLSDFSRSRPQGEPDRGKGKYSLYLALVEIQTLSGY